MKNKHRCTRLAGSAGNDDSRQQWSCNGSPITLAWHGGRPNNIKTPVVIRLTRPSSGDNNTCAAAPIASFVRHNLRYFGCTQYVRRRPNAVKLLHVSAVSRPSCTQSLCADSSTLHPPSPCVFLANSHARHDGVHIMCVSKQRTYHAGPVKVFKYVAALVCTIELCAANRKSSISPPPPRRVEN